MKLVDCIRCGSNELTEVDGFLICTFCRSKFVPESSDVPVAQTEIELNSDVKRLLDLCESDPANRKRYAGLVLDIDPSNQRARQYL